MVFPLYEQSLEEELLYAVYIGQRPRYGVLDYRPRCKHFEFSSLESYMCKSDRIGYLPYPYGIEGTV